MEKIARKIGLILLLIIAVGIIGFAAWAIVVYLEIPENFDDYLLEVFCFVAIGISTYVTYELMVDGLKNEIKNEIKNKRKEEKEG